jgi:1-acyl-sn-glycerol-3-phosphate acyltransferase
MMLRALILPFARLRIWRADETEPTGGAVLVANHISHFDPPLIAFAFSRCIDFMTTSEFYENRIARAWLNSVNTFPVDRFRLDRRTLHIGRDRLKAGRLVGVFPDGGIRAGAASILEEAPIKRGAVALAQVGHAPIIPCVVLGSDRLYAHRRWIPGSRTPVWVAIGPTLQPDGPGLETRLSKVMRELYRDTVDHFKLTPDDLPAAPAHRKGRDR